VVSAVEEAQRVGLMTNRRDKAPAPIIRKTAKGFAPVSAYDADLVMAAPLGAEFELVRRSRRSLPQQRLYWQALGQVVRATGKWPTAEHLHHELKLICGYRMTVVNWDTGEVSTAVDSTAFDAMTQDEFRVYFDLAMSKLSEHIRFNVLAFMETPA
jgi:hypothetical protein